MRIQRAVAALLLLGLLAACGGQQSTAPTAPAATAVPTVPAQPTAVLAPLPTAAPPESGAYYQPPEWARGAVIYQVFVRTFTPEGTLQAATVRLQYVRDLGVDIVYLLPIHPIGEEQRKGSLGSPYSIKDYRAIDPALGTEEDFRAFVETAHQLGLKVMMDLVFNHTAWDNPLINEHPDWYTRNAAGEVVPPNPDWTDVADLNYDSLGLRHYMVETSLYWVEEFGIDGFRCDVSEAVPSEFWLQWRAALKTANPDLLLLSESGGLQMYQAGFEVAYDWDTRGEFVKALLNPRLARTALTKIGFEQRQYGPELWRMRYLENHDQERIAAATRDPGQRRAAAAFLLTIPGLPLIYAGQEVGATERPSLFEPFTVDFAGGDQSLRETYAELIKLRDESPALRLGTFERVANDTRTVLLYERRAPDQRVLVAINMAPDAAHVPLESISSGTDLATGAPLDLSSGLQLDGYAYRLIELPQP